MLLISHVTKKYGKFLALDDISLELGHGVYGLLSPNGGGKTTLIKLLATLLFPTEGEIIWDGMEIWKLGEKYRDILGYLPQDFGYYKNHSPRNFLDYISALKGIEGSVAKRKIDELLELVGLRDVKDKKMKQFSGGMIQRVGIAQAMLNDPKLLILDEPTAGLDPKERVRFRNLISSLSKDRIVILSTHIVSDIESIANKIIMIKDKKILCNDTHENICKMLMGKVFETKSFTPSLDNFLLTERQEGNQTIVRFVSENGANTDCTAVPPNLEDVFLYVYRDGAK